MNDPIIERFTMSRLPFAPRPAASASRALVFEMPGGQLRSPEHEFTDGELWWRGPRVYYKVRTAPFRQDFDREVPSSASTLFFTAKVKYRWRIFDPSSAIRSEVDAPSVHRVCADFLAKQIGEISRKFSFEDLTAVQAEVQDRFEGGRTDIGSGIEMTSVSVEMRLPESLMPIIADIERHEIHERLKLKQREAEASAAAFAQGHKLELHGKRVDHYMQVLAAGQVAAIANIMAGDSSRAPEALAAMTTQADKDRAQLIEMLKTMTEAGAIRSGDFDPLLTLAVDGLTAAHRPPQSRLGTTPPDDEPKKISGSAADPEVD
ncbi:hypothetical protein AB0I28_22590 [Phytomonospora sp. NPDC050363]|uniref:hypothetical protein n=1 Tax=Phytomonospora sp. NPDC050363 TaxID=3155642 RepID=UPI0033D60BD0